MLFPRPIPHLGMTLFLLASVGTTSRAKTLTVGQANTTCPNPTFRTITDALTAAAPGDVVAICPALYTEQLVVTKPVTLRGISISSPDDTINRVLLQPASLTNVAGLPMQAVITVLNTRGVTIENLALDASKNTVSACTPSLSAVHYWNSSGTVYGNAITGAQLQNPSNCTDIFGNGYGVLIDTDGSRPGPFRVTVENNSIHDFMRNGVLATGSGVVANVSNNTIASIGPSSGPFQFGIFVRTGAFGSIVGNDISEGLCGSLAVSDCFNLRSEGVVLRAAADGSVVDRNVIMKAQIGIFLNGGRNYRITRNRISNIDVESGIHMQGHSPGDTGTLTGVLVESNRIFHLTPIANKVCGIYEEPDSGVMGNFIVNNTINDAYCGVEHVTADLVLEGQYFNTLYNTLNVDLYPGDLPAPTEP